MTHEGMKRRWTRTFRAAIAAAVLASPLAVHAQEAKPAVEAPAVEVGSKMAFSAGIDFTTHYFFRGIFQENQGGIAQPWAELGATLWEGDGFFNSFGLKAGIWNSIHDEKTLANVAGGVDMWYEADLYAGVTFSFLKDFSGSFTWTAYSSPNDAFDTIHEVAVDVSYGGDNFVGWLAPKVLVAFEVDNAADGGDEGIYVQLGIKPGFDLVPDKLNIAFPVTVGLSGSDYYESPTGVAGRDNDDAGFGYISAGVVAGFPLDFIIPKDYGDWNGYVGVDFLWLGSTAEEFTDNGDELSIIGKAGISLSF